MLAAPPARLRGQGPDMAEKGYIKQDITANVRLEGQLRRA